MQVLIKILLELNSTPTSFLVRPGDNQGLGWAVIECWWVESLLHTCFEGSLETLVGSGSVGSTLKHHPSHVSSTPYRFRQVTATKILGEEYSKFCLDVNLERAIVMVSFTNLHVSVFTVFALFQVKCLEGNLDLASSSDY